MNDKVAMDSDIIEKPLVTIIAICHNQGPYVLETLESIRKQTYNNIELIIINNLKDNCRNIIENWIKEFNVQCRFIQNEQPLSIVKNFNLGLSFTDGKYFQGIACDDVLDFEKIEKQVNVFETLQDNYACVFSDMVYIDERCILLDFPSFIQQLKNGFSEDTIDGFNFKNLLSGCNPIPAPTVLMKTAIIKAINGYDESVDIEDYSINLKLFQKGYNFFYSDFVSVKYRLLNNSLSMIFRRQKFEQVYNLLIKYKDTLNVNSDLYRFKLFKGTLLTNNFLTLNKRYLKYLKVTGDYSPVTYMRLIYHFFNKTIYKKQLRRF